MGSEGPHVKEKEAFRGTASYTIESTPEEAHSRAGVVFMEGFEYT